MPDPFEPQGTLPNITRWMGRLGQASRNVIRGEGAAALRQIGDFALEPVDAFLPFVDAIPTLSQPEDYVSGSELVGGGGTATDIAVELATDPLTYLTFGTLPAAGQAAKHAVSVGLPFYSKATVPILTGEKAMDPLSLAMRGIDTGAKAAARGVDTALGRSSTVAGTKPGVEAAYEAGKAKLRRTFGADKLGDATRKNLQETKAIEGNAAKVWQQKVVDALGGLSQEDRVLLGKAFAGVDLGTLKPSAAKAATAMVDDPMGNIAVLAQRYGKDPAPLQAAAARLLDISKAQWDEAVAAGVFRDAGGAKDYVHREWLFNGPPADVPGKVGAEQARSLKTPQEVADFINANMQTHGFEMDVGKLMLDRARQQGSMLSQIDTARRYGGVAESEPARAAALDVIKSLSGRVTEQEAAALKKGIGYKAGGKPETITAARGRIEKLVAAGKITEEEGAQILEGVSSAPRFGAKTLGDEIRLSAVDQVKKLRAGGAINDDEAYRIEQAIVGMKPRTGLNAALAGFNRAIKGPLVYGVVLPKFGSMVRNKLGMVMQAAATPGAREEAFYQFRNGLNDLARSFTEAYGGALFGGSGWGRGDKLGEALNLVEDAFKRAKNTADVDGILRATRPDLADAVKYGVLDGFVSTEELVGKLSRNPTWGKVKDLYDAPAIMFQAIEQRGRLGAYLRMHQKSGDPASVAAKVKDAFFDYDISSPENRTLRDWVPFGQFVAKAIPQQAKLLSERPAVGVAAAPLFTDTSGDEPPIYPWMQGKTRMGVGADAAGNEQYLTGFGLPLEALDVVPNLSAGFRQAGRDVSQGVVSQLNPLVKSGVAWAMGKDPYFGTDFGSYDKIPGVGNAGDAGRLVNIAAGTGLLDRFGYGMVRQAGNLMDDTKGAGARVADLMTGAKLVSVDPDRAGVQAMQEYLGNRPDIKSYKTFYSNEDDPELKQVMQAIQQAKKNIKAKQEAAAAL